MRSLVLAAATAAAVAVPGTASALPGGVLTYCTSAVRYGPGAYDREVAFVGAAYSIDSGAVATYVRCTVRSGSIVWGSAQQATPGPASVAAGTATVPARATAEVCVTGTVTYTNGSTLTSPETCQPLSAPIV